MRPDKGLIPVHVLLSFAGLMMPSPFPRPRSAYHQEACEIPAASLTAMSMSSPQGHCRMTPEERMVREGTIQMVVCE